MFYSCIYW